MSPCKVKILPLVLSLLLMTGSAVAQSTVLNYFNVRSEGANVHVQWEIQDESGVSEFQLYRKLNEGASFELVATILSTGAQGYDFLDDQIFKNESRVITYELQVLRQGRVYKFYTTLSHNPTAVQRTWGSIKSMFK